MSADAGSPNETERGIAQVEVFVGVERAWSTVVWSIVIVAPAVVSGTDLILDQIPVEFGRRFRTRIVDRHGALQDEVDVLLLQCVSPPSNTSSRACRRRRSSGRTSR